MISEHFIQSACEIKVIETIISRGTGTDNDPVRQIAQYWSLNGELMFEIDNISHNKSISRSLKIPQD